MERSIPLWLLFLFFLLWLVFTVAFGWAVKSTLSGGARAGALGEAAVQVASFPTLAEKVFLEIFGYASGGFRDRLNSTRREEGTDYSLFSPLPTVSDVEVPGLFMRADKAKMSDGWRVLAGAFQIDTDIENAILLISPELEIVNVWILDEIQVGDLELAPEHRKLVHGMEVLPDGSVIFTFDGGTSLQKFNVCGEREWIVSGKYHHAVTLDDAGDTVWTFSDGPVIAQATVADGSVVRQIHMDEVIAANPKIDILEIRREHSSDLGGNSRNTAGNWLPDRFHLNDVDPLPAAFADQFSGFDAADLLISARSLNLIFVMDPETLEIKWWRTGAVQRQHDPDWLENGKIMVFNNRMSRDFSEIVVIDPDTFEKVVFLDGRDHGFYTRIRGKQQMLDDGTLVVTSPQQGRAFEVASDGERVFEVVNTKPGTEDTNYIISELRWFPRNYFAMETWECPTSN